MIKIGKATKSYCCDACNKGSKTRYGITFQNCIGEQHYQIDVVLCDECLKQLGKLIDKKTK